MTVCLGPMRPQLVSKAKKSKQVVSRSRGVTLSFRKDGSKQVWGFVVLDLKLGHDLKTILGQRGRVN